MGNVWFTSDSHFFHENFLKFTDNDGNLIRPFADVGEMNQRIIDGWNEVIKDGDKVYHLGDVTFKYGPAFDHVMSCLKGQKRLVVGNHDLILPALLKHFKKSFICRFFGQWGFVITHIPISQANFGRKCVLNVHGHTHQTLMKGPYLNVCVEPTNYRPVHLDEILTEVAKWRKAD